MNPLALGMNFFFVGAVPKPVAKLIFMINHGSLPMEAEGVVTIRTLGPKKGPPDRDVPSKCDHIRVDPGILLNG